MLLYGKKLLFAGKEMDIKERINEIDKVTIDQVVSVIDEFYNVDKIATATVGPTRGALKF